MADGSLASISHRQVSNEASIADEPTASLEVVSPGRKPGRQTLLLFVGSIAVFGVSLAIFVASEQNDPPLPIRFGFLLATALAFASIVRGLTSLGRSGRAEMKISHGLKAAVVFAILGNGFMVLVGALFAFMSTAYSARGRQLRRFGRVLLPPVRANADWTTVSLDVDAGDPELRRALAAQWRENGRTEHASVAAFARLTLDLMALGAPPELVAASNRDALDEIRHTELCFSLARALDGESHSPGPFPEASRAHTLPRSRTLALAALAVDSLVDGALHEGVSARMIAKLTKRCEEPRIREVLKEIAADEGRHAAHGWDVVAYCLEEGGDAVASALRGALKALPRSIEYTLPALAEDGSWERHGLHGRKLEAEEFDKTLTDLQRRVGGMIAERSIGAAA